MSRVRVNRLEDRLGTVGVNTNEIVSSVKLVNGIKNLKQFADVVQQTKGYHTGTAVNGSEYVWNPNRAWSAHNGKSVIASGALAVYDGTAATEAAFLAWTGIGNGCWEEVINATVSGGISNALSVANDAKTRAIQAQNEIDLVEIALNQTNQNVGDIGTEVTNINSRATALTQRVGVVENRANAIDAKFTDLASLNATTQIAGVAGNKVNSSVNCIKDLESAPKNVNTTYTVKGYHINTVVGGGEFVWNPDKAWSAHNGGTVIAQDALAVWDGVTEAGLTNFLNWTGTGTGCWERLNVGDYVTPEMFGALGNNISDDTIAINSAFKVLSSLVVFYNTYKISNTIIVPSTSNIKMQPGSSIFCTGANFDAVFDISSGVPESRQYYLTKIDCNGIAGTPLWLRQGKQCDISCANAIAPRLYGLRLGSDGTIISYGHHIFNYRANRQLGATSSNDASQPITNNNTIGLWEQNTTDVKGVNIEMVGFQIGHIGGGTGIYYSFHVWASQAQNLMNIGFIPDGSSKYFGAHADQVQQYGWDIREDNWRVGLYGCVHFNSPNGGTAVGTSVSVRVHPSVQQFVCYGLEIKGNVAGVAQDFDVTDSQLDSQGFIIEGTTYEFVAIRKAQYKRRLRGENLEAISSTGVRGIQIGTTSTTTFIKDDKAGGLLCRGSFDGFEINQGALPMSFNGNTPTTRPVVTGSRSSGAALNSLLDKLSILGLITNDTSA